MALKKAISAAEVPAGTMKKVNIDGTILLIANVSGTFYALNNTCPHMGGSLAGGKLEGNIVRCPRHGAQFDVTTGKNVGPAKMAFLKLNVKDVQSYPVKISDGTDVMVDMPE